MNLMTKPPILGDEPWLTVQELAARLGVSNMAAYKAMHGDNGLEVVFVGKRYYIREASIAVMLKAKTEKRMAAVTCFDKA